ncbi:MAG TPA: hypothetical protein VFX96_12465, partial [Pyrinomonadaceae bacterium]|nr:hypothetical protein [Pyrinomonadaceae bacterium]
SVAPPRLFCATPKRRTCRTGDGARRATGARAEAMPDAHVSTSHTFAERARRFARRAELPADALLGLYFAVFARQYLWFLTDNQAAAWALSSVAGAAALFFYVSSKDESEETTARLPFWLVVALPLAFVYSMRVVFPDVSFDVLNYRLLHAERALEGFVYRADEFFPTPAPYNPAPDMVTGLFRHALGYRLGTIANLFAYVWAARVCDKLLRPHLRGAWLRAGGVLLVVVVEHALFEINNYMADLLALPLVLEATYLALRLGARDDAANNATGESTSDATTDATSVATNAAAGVATSGAADVERRLLARVALLLGMSVAFKLTNAAVALPVVLLCAYRVLASRHYSLKGLARPTLVCLAAFLVTFLPFAVYLWRETGSPVFPVYNGIFRSAYWPQHSVWDPRWGPSGLMEKLLWPVLIPFRTERLCELAVYTGRISFGFVAALAALIFARRDARLVALSFVVAGGALFWSFSTGYIRYALAVELLAGVAILAFASWLARASRPRWREVGVALAVALWLALTWQAARAWHHVKRQEWAGRPTLLKRPDAFEKEAAYLLRDHSARDFLTDEWRERFDSVEVWVASGIKTPSIEVLLNERAPVIGVNTYQYFDSDESRARFRRALERTRGRRIASLAFAENLETAKADLERRGLTATSVTPFELPYFSPHLRIPMFFIEVGRADEGVREGAR